MEITETKNYATIKKTNEPFWIATVNVLDGKIEEHHTYEEAESMDFHHAFVFSTEQCEKIDNGEVVLFWWNEDGVGTMDSDNYAELDNIWETLVSQIDVRG